VLTVGAEYSYHPDANQENFDQGGARFLDDHRAFGTFGVYAQDEITPTDGLTLVTGVRFDRTYGRISEASPRAAVIWRARPATTMKVLFGQAFRPPNLFEQYYALAGDPPPPGSSLHPERIRTYEAVLEQGLWRDALGTVSLYHYDVGDLIDQVQVVNDAGVSILQYRNTSNARATGAELELRAQLPGGGTMRASYAIQDARSKNGRLSNSPRHLGRLGVLFPIVAGLEAAAELDIVGPRTTLNGRQLETAPIANVNLVYHSPLRNLDLAVGLYNVLDRTYPDPGGAEHLQDRIPQDGFTYRVQLHYGF
jgi:iron complex outermembrane receptor protein